MQINSSHMQGTYLQYPAVQSRQGTETTTEDSTASGQKDTVSQKQETDAASEEKNTSNQEQFTTEEIKELDYLKKRDNEVRAHELAHVMAGGIYVSGGAKLQHEKGPDGNSYAVGGEVSIDSSKVSGDPEATARKMQIIRRAALAPASPSSQDRKVAAQASQLEVQSRVEISLEQVLEQSEARDNEDDQSGNNSLIDKYSAYGSESEKGNTLDIAV